MLTRQNRNSTDSKDKKKGPTSVSSLDNLDSSSSESKKSLVPSSPSALSTCSNSSTDHKKKKRRKSSESSDKDKKRHLPVSDSEDKFSKRKRGGRSDSDSVSDSSISGAEEETPNDGDNETNQDDLTSSSPPTTPSPLESDYKQDKATPVTISAESEISEKLSSLPRPEPQHPTSLGLQNPLFQLPGQLSVSSSQGGFVPLPPLPAFAFRPPCPLPDGSSVFPRPPFVPPAETLTSASDSANTPGEPPVGSATSPFRPCESDAKTSSTSAVSSVLSDTKVKEEVVSPPHSPQARVMIKQEPRDSVEFMAGHPGPHTSTSVSASESYSSERKQFELLTPKHEPGLISTHGPHPMPLNSLNIPPELTSRPNPNPNPLPSDLTMTSRAEVKGQSEPLNMKGHSGEGQESDRSKSVELEIMEESDSDREGTLTPGPVPTPCNKELLRSKTAIFIKLLNRGEHNSCSRCDLMFKPLPESKLAKKREERERRMSAPTTPLKEESSKRKSNTPTPNPTADAHVVSSLPPSHQSHQDRITPRSYPDTPALRQLSEYAKPHALGQDPRSVPGYVGFSPFMDPIRMASMYPPNSRERLELELERDKRERDARERELREQELRTMEMREKLKAELEMKPPGLERLLPPGANPLDPHWLEMQRRYGPHMLPGGSGSSHIPGVYPPTSLASDLMARERERLERLDFLQSEQLTSRMIYQIYTQRLTHEQHVYMQRVSNELVMRAGAVPAGMSSGFTKPEHPSVEPSMSHLVYQFSRADPMSGVNGGNTQTPPGSLSSLPVGVPPHVLASREQELLQSDLYRRAYADPALAQQLHAQHEAAIQRMVMDRERFGSGLPPPH